MSSVYHIMYI